MYDEMSACFGSLTSCSADQNVLLEDNLKDLAFYSYCYIIRLDINLYQIAVKIPGKQRSIRFIYVMKVHNLKVL